MVVLPKTPNPKQMRIIITSAIILRQEIIYGTAKCHKLSNRRDNVEDKSKYPFKYNQQNSKRQITKNPPIKVVLI
jgi:hypothetical protein